MKSYLLHFWFIVSTILWPVTLNIDDVELKPYYIFVPIALLSVTKLNLSTLKIGIGISILGLLNFYYQIYFGVCLDYHTKFILTFPIFATLIIFGYNLGQKCVESDWINLRKISQWVLFLGITGIVIEFLFPEYFISKAPYQDFYKYSGFFKEPSHLAYSIFPCLALVILSGNNKTKLFGAVSVLVFLIFSRSSTLIVLLMALLLINFFKLKNIIVLIVIAILLTISPFDSNYFIAPTIERVQGVFMEKTSSTNLSSLVYLQGLQDAVSNIYRSKGVGIGFNMMGCTPLPEVPARDLIQVISISPLNSEDGSFLFSKIISEFGVLGIVFFCFLFYVIKKLYNIKNIEVDKNKKEAFSIIFILLSVYVAIFFIRGAGYFDGPFLMIAPILGAASNCQYKKYRA